TTDTQVYGGVEAETKATDQAVRDTAGLVLMREGKLIWGDYYDDCGGVTSPGEQEGDYPPSLTDAPPNGGPDYCARGTYHAWTLSLRAEEIEQRLNEKSSLSRSSGTLTGEERGRLASRHATKRGLVIGHVREVQIAEKDTSGRVRRIR